MTAQKIKSILKYALCSVCAEVFVQLKCSRRRQSFAVGHFGHKVCIWKSANSHIEETMKIIQI